MLPGNYVRAPKPGEHVKAEWERQARECLLWRMTPDTWDALTQEQYTAFHSQWAKIQKEAAK